MTDQNTQEKLKQVQTWLGNKEYEKVIQSTQEILDQDPTNQTALGFLREAHEGKTIALRQLHSQTQKNTPVTQKPDNQPAAQQNQPFKPIIPKPAIPTIPTAPIPITPTPAIKPQTQFQVPTTQPKPAEPKIIPAMPIPQPQPGAMPQEPPTTSTQAKVPAPAPGNGFSFKSPTTETAKPLNSSITPTDQQKNVTPAATPSLPAMKLSAQPTDQKINNINPSPFQTSEKPHTQTQTSPQPTVKPVTPPKSKEPKPQTLEEIFSPSKPEVPPVKITPEKTPPPFSKPLETTPPPKPPDITGKKATASKPDADKQKKIIGLIAKIAIALILIGGVYYTYKLYLAPPEKETPQTESTETKEPAETLDTQEDTPDETEDTFVITPEPETDSQPQNDDTEQPQRGILRVVPEENTDTEIETEVQEENNPAEEDAAIAEPKTDVEEQDPGTSTELDA